MLGHFRNRQRADVRQNSLLIELEKRQLDRHRSRGDDYVLRVIGLGLPIVKGNIDNVPSSQNSAPMCPRYLVLLEEVLDALRVLTDDGVFPLHHRRQIERDATDLNAVLGGVQPCELIVL